MYICLFHNLHDKLIWKSCIKLPPPPLPFHHRMFCIRVVHFRFPRRASPRSIRANPTPPLISPYNSK